MGLTAVSSGVDDCYTDLDFLAKLDGTARGGIVLAIKDQLDIPVKFVGLGEKPEAIAEFDPNTFVEALFS